MVTQIAQLLIEYTLGFFIFLLLLRFYMQLLRAPFRTPVGHLVTALSNWIVLPVRRLVPGFGGIDWSTLLLAWLAQVLMLALLLALRGYNFADAPGSAIALLFGVAAVELIRLSIYLLIGVVIVQAILSWVNPHSPISPTLDALTRPFYSIFRRFVPPVGGIDLSPLFVLILAQVLLILLAPLSRLAAM
jgi:YggT family protein